MQKSDRWAQRSFCYSIKSILGNLNLGHLWISEEIGEYSDWVSVVGAAIKSKDTDLWLLAMQEKSKLRLYRTLKTDLKPEEYLSWTVSAQQRALYAQLRSGTHQLRIEVGRWSQEAEADKVWQSGKRAALSARVLRVPKT